MKAKLTDLEAAGLVILLVGIVVVAVSLFSPDGRIGRGKTKFGGVVMVGPIPIVFGSDAKWASVAVVLAIVLLVVGLLYYVI